MLLLNVCCVSTKLKDGTDIIGSISGVITLVGTILMIYYLAIKMHSLAFLAITLYCLCQCIGFIGFLHYRKHGNKTWFLYSFVVGALIGFILFVALWFTQCYRFYEEAGHVENASLYYWLMIIFGVPLACAVTLIDFYFALVIYSFCRLPEGMSHYPNYESVYDDPEIASIQPLKI